MLRKRSVFLAEMYSVDNEISLRYIDDPDVIPLACPCMRTNPARGRGTEWLPSPDPLVSLYFKVHGGWHLQAPAPNFWWNLQVFGPPGYLLPPWDLLFLAALAASLTGAISAASITDGKPKVGGSWMRSFSARTANWCNVDVSSSSRIVLTGWGRRHRNISLISR